MLTKRENALAVLNREQPDYYGDFMPAMAMMFDPVLMGDMCPRDGLEHKDSWGTAFIWPSYAPGAHPHVTPENAVIQDIMHWQDYVKVPALTELDFSAVNKQASETDRNEQFVGFMCSAGLFERSHHLMGMATALLNYRRHPEKMAELLRVICEYKKEYIRLCANNFHPNIIFYHDDWGTKENVFLAPRVWRKIIKPLQQEISDTIHECGMLYMHHADCVCQPIAEDMVELGIDLWQGTIAQNDIPEIQRVTNGKLPMIGGIDVAVVDIPGVTESAIRAEVRRAFDTYCPGGPFFPSIPNGRCFREWNNSIYMDELSKYGRIYAQEHPIVK